MLRRSVGSGALLQHAAARRRLQPGLVHTAHRLASTAARNAPTAAKTGRLAKTALAVLAVPMSIGAAAATVEAAFAARRAWSSSPGGGPAVDSGDCALPIKYDVSAIERYWNTRPFTALLRVGDIGGTVLPLLAGAVWDWAVQTRLLPAVGRPPVDGGWKTQLGVRIREALTGLGPTFVKFGQMLSIRPDILPPELIYELQKLCDQVPSFPTAMALTVIEESLGAPAAHFFADLDASVEPIAAASLGQVYKLTRKADGVSVAVKVQRPDMRKAVSLDLFLLRRYMRFVELVKSYITNQHPYDVALLDTFGGATFGELDYLNEGRNQDEFNAGFADNSMIYVPKVYWDCTSRKVLTSEWIDGVQLAKSPPEVINTLIPTGVECFLAQLLDLGFFHSDPHPGNLLVDQQGRLVLIDFGLCARVDLPAMRSMTAALVHLMAGDVPKLLDDAVELGFLHATVDRAALLPVLERVFSEAKLAVDAQQNSSASSGEYATQMRRKQFRAVSGDLNQIFFDFPFQVPDYFALVTRALIVLEGIAVTGDPSFDLFQASYPYASRKAIDSFGLEELVGLGHVLQEHAALVRSARPAAATGGRSVAGDASSWYPWTWALPQWSSSSLSWLLGWPSSQPARG